MTLTFKSALTISRSNLKFRVKFVDKLVELSKNEAIFKETFEQISEVHGMYVPFKQGPPLEDKFSENFLTNINNFPKLDISGYLREDSFSFFNHCTHCTKTFTDTSACQSHINSHSTYCGNISTLFKKLLLRSPQSFAKAQPQV